MSCISAAGSLSQRVVLPRARGHQQQRVEDLVVEAGRVAKRVVTPADRIGQARPELGLTAQMLAEMREAERDVSRLVLRREPGHGRRDGVRRISLDEPEQRQERALAEHRQQE